MSEKDTEIEISVSRPKHWAVNVKLSKAAWNNLSQAYKQPLSRIGLIMGSIAIGFALANGGAILQNPAVKAILPMLKGEQQR
jgi:phosphate/sulfate permease